MVWVVWLAKSISLQLKNGLLGRSEASCVLLGAGEGAGLDRGLQRGLLPPGWGFKRYPGGDVGVWAEDWAKLYFALRRRWPVPLHQLNWLRRCVLVILESARLQCSDRLSLWEQCCLFCSLPHVLQIGRCHGRFCGGLVCQQGLCLVLEEDIFCLC